MPRTNLSVPYASKDEAKALGAKWDAENKLWFVPDGVDPAPFKSWFYIERPPEPNIRCNRFYTVTAVETCWKCSAPVTMVAFVLPRGWEEWHAAEDDDQVDEWRREEVDVMLNYIGYLNDAALKAAQAINPHYTLAQKAGSKSKKYFNHCAKCGLSQIEPNSGNIHVFKPDTVEQAELLTLHYHNENFECQSSFQSGLRCHGGYNALDHMKHNQE